MLISTHKTVEDARQHLINQNYQEDENGNWINPDLFLDDIDRYSLAFITVVGKGFEIVYSDNITMNY